MKPLYILLIASVPATLAAEIRPAADMPQPLSPAESAAKIRLPDGFRIDLVASEPLIQDPSGIAFDERGRLFVCELHGYNVEGHLDVVELNKTGVLDTKVRRLRWELMGGKIAKEAHKLQYGVVKLLTDTNGDGVMDRAQVWADDLRPCYGLVAAEGGIIVAAAPDILFFADRDGDGEVDIRETLFTGFDLTVMERGINNPTWGLDNWIYVGSGRHAGTIRGPNLKSRVELGNADFRIRADGSAIEPVSGSVGTFGLAINDIGDRFPCTGGQPARYALPMPRRALARNPYVSSPPGNHSAADYAKGFRISTPHPWRVKRAEDPAWVRFYGQRENDSNYFSGGCGGRIYRAALFPEEYHGNFFYCEPSLNIVHRCVLTRDGAGYKARRAPKEQQSEFLASTDQWFRPMNLRIGPDGAMYIVDMYREIIEDYSAIPRFLQQQYGVIKGNDRGRIWRLAPANALRKPLPDLTQWTTEQLVTATGSPNAWQRHTAQLLLIERGDRSTVKPLQTQVRNGATHQARLHALYTLSGLNALQPADVRQALGDSHYGVRLHALRLAEKWLKSDVVVLSTVIEMIGDADPRVRLQLAMTLGETTAPPALEALQELALRHGTERWMDAAILSSTVTSAGKVLLPLLARSAAGAAVKLLGPLAQTVAGSRDSVTTSRVLATLAKRPVQQQIEILKGLIAGFSRGVGLPSTPSRDWQVFQKLLRSESAEVRELATELASVLGFADLSEMKAIFSAISERALDKNLSLERRRRELQLLAHAPYSLLAATATQFLDPRQPLELQHAAVQALANSTDSGVGEALLTGWDSLTPKTRSVVLTAILTRENRLPALLNAIEGQKVLPRELSALQREQMVQTRNQRLATRAREILKNEDVASDLQARMETYRQALTVRRDTARGKEVFMKSCLPCHKVGVEGHAVGPPLGSILNKPDESILMDMLDPSGHIESEYRSYLVVTNTGLTFTGIPAVESATSLTLQKEKGEQQTILRQDIELLKASAVSLMPSNLHEQVGPVDAAHLIAFLRQAFRPDIEPGR